MASLENYPCALVMNVYFQTLDVLEMSGKHNCFLLSMWRICLYPEDCDALRRNSWKIEDTIAKKNLH